MLLNTWSSKWILSFFIFCPIGSTSSVSNSTSTFNANSIAAIYFFQGSKNIYFWKSLTKYLFSESFSFFKKSTYKSPIWKVELPDLCSCCHSFYLAGVAKQQNKECNHVVPTLICNFQTWIRLWHKVVILGLKHLNLTIYC